MKATIHKRLLAVPHSVGVRWAALVESTPLAETSATWLSVRCRSLLCIVAFIAVIFQIEQIIAFLGDETGRVSRAPCSDIVTALGRISLIIPCAVELVAFL